MQQLFFYDGAQFTGEYFESRYEKWLAREDEIGGVEEKKLTEEQLDFKKRYRWNSYHFAYGIEGIKIILYPGVLHGAGHSVTLTFEYASKFIEKNGYEYNMMLKCIASFDGYLVGGGICAGTELMYKMLHQLRKYIFLFVLFVAGVECYKQKKNTY